MTTNGIVPRILLYKTGLYRVALRFARTLNCFDCPATPSLIPRKEARGETF